MSRYDYEASKQIAAQDHPFGALVMAAMRKADSSNSSILRHAFPREWDELQLRYNSPGGYLMTDPNVPPEVRERFANIEAAIKAHEEAAIIGRQQAAAAVFDHEAAAAVQNLDEEGEVAENGAVDD